VENDQLRQDFQEIMEAEEQRELEKGAIVSGQIVSLINLLHQKGIFSRSDIRAWEAQSMIAAEIAKGAAAGDHACILKLAELLAATDEEKNAIEEHLNANDDQGD